MKVSGFNILDTLKGLGGIGRFKEKTPEDKLNALQASLSKVQSAPTEFACLINKAGGDLLRPYNLRNAIAKVQTSIDHRNVGEAKKNMGLLSDEFHRVKEGFKISRESIEKAPGRMGEGSDAEGVRKAAIYGHDLAVKYRNITR